MTTSDQDIFAYGTKLMGRLLVQEPIGFGAFSVVYRVVDMDGQGFALKVMNSSQAEHPQQIRFENEARLTRAVRNIEGIVLVHELGRLLDHQARPYILMDLVEGQTLAQMMVDGSLTPSRACQLIRETALVLERLHRLSIVHRDVKPANLMIERFDRVRLLDLGFAYSSGSDRLPRTGGSSGPLMTPGTCHYMAPEQVLGAPPSPSFDLYALTATFYETLFGQPPLGDMSAEEVLQHKLHNRIEVPPEAWTRLPASLCRLIDRGLKFLAQDRFESAHAFRLALEDVLADDFGVHVDRRPEDRPAPRGGWIGADPGATVTIPRPMGRPERSVVLQTKTGHTERIVAAASASPELAAVGMAEPVVTVTVARDVAVEPNEPSANEAAMPTPESRPPAHTTWPAAAEVGETRALSLVDAPPVVIVDATQAEPVHKPRRWRWVAGTAITLAFAVFAFAALRGLRKDAETSPPGRGDFPEVLPAGTFNPPSAAGYAEEAKIEDASLEPEPRADNEPADARIEATSPAEPPPDHASEQTSDAPSSELPRRTERSKARRTPPERGGNTSEPHQPDIDCTDVEARAKRAFLDEEWKTVLSLTKTRTCWSDDVSRVLFRITALSETGAYEACVRLGENASHDETRIAAMQCKRKVAESRDP